MRWPTDFALVPTFDPTQNVRHIATTPERSVTVAGCITIGLGDLKVCGDSIADRRPQAPDLLFSRPASWSQRRTGASSSSVDDKAYPPVSVYAYRCRPIQGFQSTQACRSDNAPSQAVRETQSRVRGVWKHLVGGGDLHAFRSCRVCASLGP